MRYLNPANQHLITKDDKEFTKTLYFKDIQFPVKIRDIDKIGKKKSVDISVLAYGKKETHAVDVSKHFCQEKHLDFSLTGEGGENTML